MCGTSKQKERGGGGGARTRAEGLQPKNHDGSPGREHPPVDCVSLCLCWVLDVWLVQQLLDAQEDLKTRAKVVFVRGHEDGIFPKHHNRDLKYLSGSRKKKKLKN